MPSHPVHGGKFVKALQGGGVTHDVAAASSSSTAMTTPPKMEVKKKKKQKTPKATFTSETISPPEKMKKRVATESPDSNAEGPFRDSDCTESAPENSPHTS